MKKLILSLTVAAFAVAVQAGGDACEAAKSCCPSKAAETTKASCGAATTACSGQKVEATSTCTKDAAATTASKKTQKPLKTPKANAKPTNVASK